MVFFRIQNLVFFGLIENRNPNFEVTSNIKYVLKTGNPKESTGKDRTTFSLRKKALKKNSPGQN